jgi:hypothetical protein
MSEKLLAPKDSGLFTLNIKVEPLKDTEKSLWQKSWEKFTGFEWSDYLSFTYARHQLNEYEIAWLCKQYIPHTNFYGSTLTYWHGNFYLILTP